MDFLCELIYLAWDDCSAAASIDLEEDKSNLADVALSLNIEDIPETAEKANVPLEALYNVSLVVRCMEYLSCVAQ